MTLISITKTWLLGAVLLPLLMIRPGLSEDGQKYLDEARSRVHRIDAQVEKVQTPPEKAETVQDQLLAAQRFLDHVLAEQPKHKEAKTLHKKAEGLLAKLEPVLLKAAIGQRLSDVDRLLGKLEKDLIQGITDDEAEASLARRLDMARELIQEVLKKEPANAQALQAGEKKNELYKKFRKLSEARSRKP